MDFNYDVWIKQAKDRLELLYDQRDAISNEIAALERGIEAFQPLAKAAWIGPDAGITDAIRKIVSSERHRLFSPLEIRRELVVQGVKLTQKNSMATIHQVLARLVEKGVVKVQISKGKNLYRWIGEEGRDDIMKRKRVGASAFQPSPGPAVPEGD
jgi:hypothetical protein